ncbi:MAG: alpha/beta fold hydrolase [Enhydrobacter sp.]|nr:alpha/beta fold hydrolase [Enhydrobacter sp.]
MASAKAAIDKRRILRFPPSTNFRNASLSGAREGATQQMPHVKLRDGAELYYERHGTGSPLLLVPGLGGDSRWWGENVAKLAEQFTVIVHDHRGTGRSTLSRIDYSVAQMADDALQLVDALGFEKVHWCGHSTGGAMGQVLAIEHPERIDRLVLSATWAKTDAFFRRLFETRALMLKELGPVAYQKSSALALNSPWWVRDHDADLAVAEAKANETIPIPEIVLSRIAAIVAHDRRDQLQTVKSPTLAICARDDMVTPLYFTEELVRLIPNARSYILPDGGHFYPNVHGAEFRRVMTAFLLES